ncbi:DUF3304 domain-containing protein [Vreelandella stevensii]|uniref:DUF3304 domain-containing protein n=1 Tax=Vreelandella stevensii TaxID=502821 RepID=UPI00403AC5F9
MLVRWAISRYLRLLPAWLKILLAGLFLIWLAWEMILNTSKNGSLAGYNHTERPIFSYWVDGNWGGNMAPYSWGSTTCCWSFKNDTVEVVWILDVTPEDIEAGLDEERYSLTLPMPEHTREDQYLHVHFISDNKVDLVWSQDIRSPKFDEYRGQGE